MNTKNNKRRRESVERIEKTFVELLQTKELSEISVSDICKRCDLNRSTFYANYADVYALADKIRKDLEKDVMALYNDGTQWIVQDHDFLRLFQHIQENPMFYRTYFKLGYDGQYQITIYDAARADRDFPSKQLSYHMAFFQSGFNAIVKKWLAGGCQETPEEMNEIILSEYRGRH